MIEMIELVVGFEHNTKRGDKKRFYFVQPERQNKDGTVVRGEYSRHHMSAVGMRKTIAAQEPGTIIVYAAEAVKQELVS